MSTYHALWSSKIQSKRSWSPYTETDKGATKTLRTEENIDGFMDSMENIVYDPDTAWFDDRMYQGSRSYSCLRQEKKYHCSI